MIWQLVSIADSGLSSLAELSPTGEVTNKEMTLRAAELINDYNVFENNSRT